MKINKKIIASICAISIALAVVDTAQSQTAPLTAFSIPTASAVLDVVKAGGALLWGAGSLLVYNAGAAAGTITTAAGALGITPVGWALAGAAAAGAVYLENNPTALDGTMREAIAIVVSFTQTTNPDFIVQTAQNLPVGLWVWPAKPWISTTASPPQSDSGFIFAINEQMGQLLPDGYRNLVIPSLTQTSTATRIYFSYEGFSKTTNSWYAGGSYVDKNAIAIGCTADFFYNPKTSQCEKLMPGAGADKLCKVIFNAAGDAEFSDTDPDCQTAVGSIALKKIAATATTPPGVSFQQNGESAVVITKPKLATQGTVGSINVQDLKYDAKNQTTIENKTVIAPAINGAPPKIENAAQKTMQGQIDPKQAAGAAPINSVIIGNWPNTLNVNCANCAAAAPVIIPEKFKIDGEIPAGTPDLPAIETVDTKTFLAPLQTKLASFFNYSFPAHTSTCSPLNIKFAAWGINIDISNNSMCVFLDEHKTFFQSITKFGYIAGAIIIVLGA
jgi:hypothetical protein